MLQNCIPPPKYQVGESSCTLLRQGAVSPNHVPEKNNNKACVLGMGCGRCQHIRVERDAAWGTRGHLPRTGFPYPSG